MNSTFLRKIRDLKKLAADKDSEGGFKGVLELDRRALSTQAATVSSMQDDGMPAESMQDTGGLLDSLLVVTEYDGKTLSDDEDEDVVDDNADEDDSDASDSGHEILDNRPNNKDNCGKSEVVEQHDMLEHEQVENSGNGNHREQEQSSSSMNRITSDDKEARIIELELKILRMTDRIAALKEKNKECCNKLILRINTKKHSQQKIFESER